MQLAATPAPLAPLAPTYDGCGFAVIGQHSAAPGNGTARVLLLTVHGFSHGPGGPCYAKLRGICPGGGFALL